MRREGGPFRSIESVRTPRLDRIYDWSFRRIFKSSYRSQALTAFNYPFSLAFEWCAWRQLRRRIRFGEFDVVLRLLPIVSVLPSFFAFLLRNGPIPFVIGPVNGGLPWPAGFGQAENQKEWISGLSESLSIPALREGHIWECSSHRGRFVPNICRICGSSR